MYELMKTCPTRNQGPCVARRLSRRLAMAGAIALALASLSAGPARADGTASCNLGAGSSS